MEVFQAVDGVSWRIFDYENPQLRYLYIVTTELKVEVGTEQGQRSALLLLPMLGPCDAGDMN